MSCSQYRDITWIHLALFCIVGDLSGDLRSPTSFPLPSAKFCLFPFLLPTCSELAFSLASHSSEGCALVEELNPVAVYVLSISIGFTTIYRASHSLPALNLTWFDKDRDY